MGRAGLMAEWNGSLFSHQIAIVHQTQPAPPEVIKSTLNRTISKSLYYNCQPRPIQPNSLHTPSSHSQYQLSAS